jgi:radical SAM protein with 4Fe4S-binding SPASM domain
LYIQLFPTFRCNASCGFCFNRRTHAVSDMEAPDFAAIAGRLASADVQEIDILGGEPTLHPELATLIDIACSNDISVSISTNGSKVKTLRVLAERFGQSRLVIGVSLGNRPAHATLADFICEHQPWLKSVCSRQHFISDTGLEFLKMPGIRYHAIFMDTLNAADLEEGLSFPEYYLKLQQMKREYANLEGVYCAGFISDSDNFAALNRVRCPAGTAKLSVMPDGSVYPCYLFFGKPEFRLGNLLREDLNIILNSPILDFFRRFEKNNCPDMACRHFSDCHGGCPALSLMLHGDLKAPDPRCVVRS